MTDEIEYGPDPNQIRRHQKRMLTAVEYQKQYRRLGYYRPSPKQMEFHNLHATERALRAGNQVGKSTAGAAQLAMDAIGFYPDWYTGRRHVPPKIERPFEFLGWAACTTSQTTRDGIQTKLLGDIRQEGGLGTGLIPLDNIVGRPTMARGIADFVDTITLRRETGGRAIIRQKTYDQGARVFQGEAVDQIWLDEDVSREDDTIYGEALARLTSTSGRIILTMTPLLGMSPIRKRFKERLGTDCAEVLMSIYDAAVSKGGHIPDEKIPEIIARYRENEKQTRIFGSDMQGEGAVFTTPVDAIKYTKDPREFPPWCRWIWGTDFSHGGMSASAHPFAAALLCHDAMPDVVYVVHAVRLHRALPAMHVEAIKKHPCWDAPVAWPHDGNRGADMATGETFRAMYRRLGLNMRPQHACFPGAEGYGLEAGLTVMENRTARRGLLIASDLTEVFDEYVGYHRVNGLVHKVDDDLLSAIRVGLMDLRYAKPLGEAGFGPAGSFDHRGAEQKVAHNVDFDVFSGGRNDDYF
jgi:phage terminase large subunit-like protein